MLQLVTNMKIDYLEIAKIWLVKFCIFNFKMVYLTQFLLDLISLGLNCKLVNALFKTNSLENRMKDFCSIVDEMLIHFWDPNVGPPVALTPLHYCKRQVNFSVISATCITTFHWFHFFYFSALCI